jgi:hypothetical protein
VAAHVTSTIRGFYRRSITKIRTGPLAGKWLFAWVFLSQLGHLIEHIAKQISGSGLLGPSFDSEVSHLVFNGVIALVSLLLVAVYPCNPWVYPLAVLSVFHGIEHVYIFEQFTRTGLSDGPGLLGRGGAIGVIPIDRLDLHNIYNGAETILIVLGFWHEIEFDSANEGSVAGVESHLG